MPPTPIPAEDPEIVRLRQEEARRAEEDRIRAIQEQLRLETLLRGPSRGVRSLVGAFDSSGFLKSVLGSG
jgi:hypothetical protein